MLPNPSNYVRNAELRGQPSVFSSRDTFPVHVPHAFLTPALRPKRDISWTQGNSIWADSRRHGNDRVSALTFGKARGDGAGTEESPMGLIWEGLQGQGNCASEEKLCK